jgi:hypothetical protein
MGTLFQPKFYPAYVKVAREYGLPFLTLRAPGLPVELVRETDIFPDSIVLINEKVKPEDWVKFYAGLVEKLKPGLTELIVHLGHDDAELQAVTVGHPAFGSEWRQRDFDAMTHPEFRAAIERNHVKVVGWKEIQAHWGR